LDAVAYHREQAGFLEHLRRMEEEAFPMEIVVHLDRAHDDAHARSEGEEAFHVA